ncbi:STAS domain-containing protein [Streptacidiphilus sp. PAMC 29251]
MNPLTLSQSTTATGPVLHVAGELDYAQAPALREHVDSVVLTPGQNLVIDLSGLDFCDSTGITVLLAARQRAQAAGADVILAAVPADTMRVLTVIGLHHVFTIHPTGDTA